MEREKIPIAGDHKAFELKSSLINYLKDLGFEPLDLGAYSSDRVDYPIYASAVAERVSRGECKRGIVLCKTGIGVSITANKFPGIRAALVNNEEIAELSRKHTDSNILALGAGFTNTEEAKKILEKWLSTKYEGGRHQARLEQISKIEKNSKRELDKINKDEAKISASLMCANQLNLLDDINKLINGGIDLFHIDIVDGKFAPNFAMSPNEVFALRSHTNLPIDVHLMVEDPSIYIPQLFSSGANIITVHVESKQDINKILDEIKSVGIKAGLAIEADTPVEKLYPYIDKIDYALFMCIKKTGFEAQPFVPEVLEKMQVFNKYLKKNTKDVKIIADGAVGPKTITNLYKSGARIFVGGTSGLFKSGTFEENILQMRSYCC